MKKIKYEDSDNQLMKSEWPWPCDLSKTRIILSRIGPMFENVYSFLVLFLLSFNIETCMPNCVMRTWKRIKWRAFLSHSFSSPKLNLYAFCFQAPIARIQSTNTSPVNISFNACSLILYPWYYFGFSI